MKWRPDEGSVMIASLVFILGLLLFATALADLAYCEKMMAGYHTGSEQALHLADAGIEKARAEVSRGGVVYGDTEFVFQLGDGEVKVEIKAPDEEGLVSIKSTANLNNRARRTVLAQMSPNSRVGILADRLFVISQGTGACIINGNTAVEEGTGFEQYGNNYLGFAAKEIDIDYFRRQARSRPDEWLVYDSSPNLTSSSFAACPNIFVDGDVDLDGAVAGCPRGSLLVTTGRVLIAPRGWDGRKAGLNIISEGPLQIRADGDTVPLINGYLHSNSELSIDLSAASQGVTLRGIWEASEVNIRHREGLIFEEDHVSVNANRVLKERLVKGLTSYRMIPE